MNQLAIGIWHSMWNCRGTPFPPDFQIHSFIFQFGVFSTLNKIIVFYLWTVIFSAPTINLLPSWTKPLSSCSLHSNGLLLSCLCVCLSRQITNSSRGCFIWFFSVSNSVTSTKSELNICRWLNRQKSDMCPFRLVKDDVLHHCHSTRRPPQISLTALQNYSPKMYQPWGEEQQNFLVHEVFEGDALSLDNF